MVFLRLRDRLFNIDDIVSIEVLVDYGHLVIKLDIRGKGTVGNSVFFRKLRKNANETNAKLGLAYDLERKLNLILGIRKEKQ
jgi:hypothetical protein